MEINKKYITIVKKAYVVWSDKIEAYDLHYLMDDVYYAKTPSEAKYQFLIQRSEYECTFIELKVKRVPKKDVILYNDGINVFEGSMSSIESKLTEIIRINEIQNTPNGTMFYVQNNNNYVGNSVLWWAENGIGYTTNIDKAWKVSKEYILTTNWREKETFWECKTVDNVISRHVDMQNLRGFKKY